MPRIDSISSVACAGHSSAAARSSAALNEPPRRLPAIPTMRTDSEEACGVPAHYLGLVRRGNAACAPDEVDRVLHAHIVGVVGAEHDMLCSIALHHVLQHGAIEGD